LAKRVIIKIVAKTRHNQEFGRGSVNFGGDWGSTGRSQNVMTKNVNVSNTSDRSNIGHSRNSGTGLYK